MALPVLVASGLQGSKHYLDGMLPGTLWRVAVVGQLFRSLAGAVNMSIGNEFRMITGKPPSSGIYC